MYIDDLYFDQGIDWLENFCFTTFYFDGTGIT